MLLRTASSEPGKICIPLSVLSERVILVELSHKEELCPGIDHIWGPLGWMRSRPSKIRKTVRLSAPKNGESGKTKTCAFRRQSSLRHFCWLSSAQLTKSVSTQEQALWETVILPPVYHGHHWCPRPPLAASVGGGGAWDRSTP